MFYVIGSIDVNLILGIYVRGVVPLFMFTFNDISWLYVGFCFVVTVQK